MLCRHFMPNTSHALHFEYMNINVVPPWLSPTPSHLSIVNPVNGASLSEMLSFNHVSVIKQIASMLTKPDCIRSV